MNGRTEGGNGFGVFYHRGGEVHSIDREELSNCCDRGGCLLEVNWFRCHCNPTMLAAAVVHYQHLWEKTFLRHQAKPQKVGFAGDVAVHQRKKRVISKSKRGEGEADDIYSFFAPSLLPFVFYTVLL